MHDDSEVSKTKRYFKCDDKQWEWCVYMYIGCLCLCMCVCTCACMCVCVCVCMCGACDNLSGIRSFSTLQHDHVSVCIHMYVYSDSSFVW